MDIPSEADYTANYNVKAFQDKQNQIRNQIIKSESKGLEGKTREEQFDSVCLFSLGKRRPKGDLMVAYSFLTRGGAGADLSGDQQ